MTDIASPNHERFSLGEITDLGDGYWAVPVRLKLSGEAWSSYTPAVHGAWRG